MSTLTQNPFYVPPHPSLYKPFPAFLEETIIHRGVL